MASSGKKDFKALEKRLLRFGFVYDHTNSSSAFVYTHPSHPNLAVSPGITEGAARNLLVKVERHFGARTKAPKRNAAAIKERQAAARQQQAVELARLDCERDAINLRKSALLNGAAAHLSGNEIRAIENRVREIENERRAIEALMHAPVSQGNQGIRSAKHEGGQR